MNDESMTDTAAIDSIRDVEQLEELLSRPTPEVIELMGRIEGDVLVLGAFGKIGPSLARMARRASYVAGASRRVIAVGRNITPEAEARCRQAGIETLRCDLLDRRQLAGLPDAPNVFYLAALKFGSTGQEALTWAMNAYLPGLVCERFSASRIVAYSTGNVYRMARFDSGGSTEDSPLEPVGDYAMSCLGRERVFTHFSQARGTPVALLRLNYAHEMRYGVMVDLSQKVLAGQAIDVGMGYFNAIWQGDSNAMTLRALEHAAAPARPINVAGPETLRVRDVAGELGRLLGKPVTFTGSEAPDALLSNGLLGYELLGRPAVTSGQMIRWVADWVARGGPTLGKPTKFQVRDGRF